MAKLPATAAQLSKRQQEIVSLYIEEELSPKQIAKQLSCTVANVYLILRRDDVRETILAATRNSISLSAFSAAKTLSRLSDSAKSEFVQLEASKALLDRAGVSQPLQNQGVLNVQINLVKQ